MQDAQIHTSSHLKHSTPFENNSPAPVMFYQSMNQIEKQAYVNWLFIDHPHGDLEDVLALFDE